MGIDIELQGIGALRDKIEQMGLKVSKVEGEALKAAAEPILKDAQSLVPVRTGNLKKSLVISNIKSSKGRKFVWVGDVDKKANYSWFVEFGHSKAPAHPFLGPAFEQNKAKARSIIRDKLKEALRE